MGSPQLRLQTPPLPVYGNRCVDIDRNSFDAFISHIKCITVSLESELQAGSAPSLNLLESRFSPEAKSSSEDYGGSHFEPESDDSRGEGPPVKSESNSPKRRVRFEQHPQLTNTSRPRPQPSSSRKSALPYNRSPKSIQRSGDVGSKVCNFNHSHRY